MKIDLRELVAANVISTEVSDAIQTYYQSKTQKGPHRLIILFGILGALLVGLGIILIVAHNWDELSRGAKVILAFIPLLMGQIASGYSISRKMESKSWREGSACFLVFAIGACISLVSQIYHIEGDLSDFLFTWSLLTLPIIYLLRSSVASLLYLILITYYLLENRYWSLSSSFQYAYWLLLLLDIPFIVGLFLKREQTNFIHFHSFLIPISISFGLASLFAEFTHLLYVGFVSLYGCIYGLGYLYKRQDEGHLSNGFIISGSLGTMFLLYLASFEDYWLAMHDIHWVKDIVFTKTLYVTIFCFLASCFTYYFYFKNVNFKFKIYLQPIMPTFIIFTILFIIGQYTPLLAQIGTNILILTIGLFTILQGARLHHLGILNYGLILITILVACRFFDTDISFVWRGIIFVSLGLGFFASNYWMITRRKKNEI